MILTIGNQKGGTGKTAIALNVAAGYAKLHMIDDSKQDLKVLVIDLDGQCNLTRLCLTNRFSERYTIYDCMEKPDLTNRCIRKVKKFGFDIIPAKADLFSYGALSGEGEKSNGLQAVIDVVKDRYDLIVIDTSPALNDLTTSAYLATILNDGHILIVGEAVSTSLDGLMSMLDMVIKPMVRHYRKHVNWSFLFNKTKGSRYEDNFINKHINTIDEQGKVVSTIPNFLPIRVRDDSTIMRKAQDSGRSVIFRKQAIGDDLRELVLELVKRGVY